MNTFDIKVNTVDQTLTSKPPLGLKPKYIHDKARVEEILDAMERYSYQRFPIPIEWIEELRGLIE